MPPFKGHSATGPEGPLYSEVPYLLWPPIKDLKVDGASQNYLAGHRYGASQHHSQGLAGHKNHAVIRRTLRGNDDRWIGHALASCRGICILVPQCKAWWSAAGDSTVERYYTHNCGANKSSSTNLNGVCKAGDSVLALFKGPEVPYWSFRPF